MHSSFWVSVFVITGDWVSFFLLYYRKVLFPHYSIRIREIYGHRGQLDPNTRIASGTTQMEFVEFLKRNREFIYDQAKDSVHLSEEGRRWLRAIIPEPIVQDRYNCRQYRIGILKQFKRGITLFNVFKSLKRKLKDNINSVEFDKLEIAHLYYKNDYVALYELLRYDIGIDSPIPKEFTEKDVMFLTIWLEK